MLEIVKNFNYVSSTENDKINLILDLLKLNDDELYENLEYIVSEITYKDVFDEFIIYFKYSEKINNIFYDILDFNVIEATITMLKKYKKLKLKGKNKKAKNIKRYIIDNVDYIGCENIRIYNRYFKHNKVKKLLYSII